MFENFSLGKPLKTKKSPEITPEIIELFDYNFIRRLCRSR